MNSIRFHGGPEGFDVTFHLASGTGWTEFEQWIRKQKGCRELKRLVRDGSAKDTRSMSNDLGMAIDDHPPDNPDVLSIAQHLWSNMEPGDPDEIATVLDGCNDEE